VTEQQYASAKVWNGTSTLKADTAYVVKSNLTISKKVTIPAGTTLTVKNGAKLIVGSKGSLYVKGSLTVSKGATLSVNGKLYEYKTGKISVSGALKLNSKSDVTLNGGVTVNSSGTISGSTKSVSVGSKAAFTVKGKNSCKKLTEAIDSRDIAKVLDSFYTTAMVDGNVYKAVRTVYPSAYITYLNGEFKKQGTTLKAFCEDFSDEFVAALSESGLTAGSVTAIDVNVTKLTDSTDSLTDEEKASMETIYGAVDKVCTVEADITAKQKSGGDVTEQLEATLANVGGKWYLYA
jgi:hypothetical protein